MVNNVGNKIVALFNTATSYFVGERSGETSKERDWEVQDFLLQRWELGKWFLSKDVIRVRQLQIGN